MRSFWTAVVLFSFVAAVQCVKEGELGLDKKKSKSAEPPKPADVIQTLLRKRKSTSQWVKHERKLSREHFSTQASLVSFTRPDASSRQKRAILTSTSNTWPRRIPYLFDSSYPANLHDHMRGVLQFIMDNLCVEFVEEPDFDPNNNNYETNAYVKFTSQIYGHCSSGIGRGTTDTGERIVEPCDEFYTGIHEMMHCLGAIHEQTGPLSTLYTSVIFSNIEQTYASNYYLASAHNLLTEEFDSSSLMMYGPTYFTSNGQETMLPVEDDSFDLQGQANYKEIFYEMNKVYQCAEFHNCGTDSASLCGNSGYRAFVKGECQCVCPDEREPDTDCEDFVGESSEVQIWPNTAFTLLAADVDDCPPGMKTGLVSLPGTAAPWLPDPSYYPTSGGSELLFPMCSQDPENGDPDMSGFAAGTYCIYKPANKPCSGGFEEGTVVMQGTTTFIGDVGGTTQSGSHITFKFCCRSDRDINIPIQLSHDHSYRIFSVAGICPSVVGTRVESASLYAYSIRTSASGSLPMMAAGSYYTMFHQCLYTTPTYGCNQVIHLDANNRASTVSTPGFGTGGREQNKRCFYDIQVPIDAQIKLTFDTFDIDDSDLVTLKRFNKWSKGQKLTNARHPKQTISDGNYTLIEFWSHDSISSSPGVQFTVEVLLAEESCFDINSRGVDYSGTMHIAETKEVCLDWADSLSCGDFPNSGLGEVDELRKSFNYCRNPGAQMKRPWCYVNKNGTMCQKRYCDVCNQRDNMDTMSEADCLAAIAADSSFCSDTLQGSACFKSCSYIRPAYEESQIAGCGAPDLPSDGSVTGGVQGSYNTGDSITVECTKYPPGMESAQMHCEQGEWSTLPSACPECLDSWMTYGDRCFKFFTAPKKIFDDAKTECTSYNGKMFEMRNQADQEMIRGFKGNSTYVMRNRMWMNSVRDNGVWELVDTNTPIPYANWTGSGPSGGYNCALMLQESASHAGKWINVNCLQKHIFACETERGMAESCGDSYSTGSCASIAGEYPEFCSSTHFAGITSSLCKGTCGTCAGAADCTVPTSSSYASSPSGATVSPGSIVTFTCNAGKYHTSGDLKRFCSGSGSLLGDAPVCADTPEPVEIKFGEIRHRATSLASGTAYLLDNEKYRVPFDGKISAWFYVLQTSGSLSLVAYRKNTTTSVYHLVGSNIATTSYSEIPWTHKVATGDQFDVQKGDVVGVYSTDALVSTSNCDSAPIKPLMFKYEAAGSLAQVTGTFGAETCQIPSFGFVVEP